jgi:hypothetical protein
MFLLIKTWFYSKTLDCRISIRFIIQGLLLKAGLALTPS